MKLSLQPHISLEAAANLRLAQKILPVDADVKLHVVAFYRELADFLSGKDILKAHKIQDFPQNAVLVALDAIRHKI